MSWIVVLRGMWIRGKGDVLEMRANDGTERIRSSERFSRRRG
jgi:hypothetical protein